VAIVDDLLRSDEKGTLLGMGRNLLKPRVGGEEAPAAALIDIFAEVMSIQPQQMCVEDDGPIDVERLAQAIEGLVGFMEDEENGIGAIYDLIGRRTDHPDVTAAMDVP
jgi:hypothetical protein